MPRGKRRGGSQARPSAKKSRDEIEARVQEARAKSATKDDDKLDKDVSVHDDSSDSLSSSINLVAPVAQPVVRQEIKEVVGKPDRFIRLIMSKHAKEYFTDSTICSVMTGRSNVWVSRLDGPPYVTVLEFPNVKAATNWVAADVTILRHATAAVYHDHTAIENKEPLSFYKLEAEFPTLGSANPEIVLRTNLARFTFGNVMHAHDRQISVNVALSPDGGYGSRTFHRARDLADFIKGCQEALDCFDKLETFGHRQRCANLAHEQEKETIRLYDNLWETLHARQTVKNYIVGK